MNNHEKTSICERTRQNYHSERFFVNEEHVHTGFGCPQMSPVVYFDKLNTNIVTKSAK